MVIIGKIYLDLSTTNLLMHEKRTDLWILLLLLFYVSVSKGIQEQYVAFDQALGGKKSQKLEPGAILCKSCTPGSQDFAWTWSNFGMIRSTFFQKIKS